MKDYMALVKLLRDAADAIEKLSLNNQHENSRCHIKDGTYHNDNSLRYEERNLSKKRIDVDLEIAMRVDPFLFSPYLEREDSSIETLKERWFEV